MADSVPSPSGPAAATQENTPEQALAHVRRVWAKRKPLSPPYEALIPDVDIVSADPEQGRVVARMALTPLHVNSAGGLHGTVSAALVDWAAGMAIVARTGGDRTGWSTDIHVSYAASARVGDTVEVECWVNRLGRTLAYTQVEIRKAVEAGGEGGTGGKGQVLVTGSHTKYVAGG